MTNPLTELLPARARQYLYAALFAAGLVVGALNVAGIDTGAAVDVLAYLGPALGALAASNSSPARPGRDEAGHGQLGLVLLVLAVVGIGLLLLGVRF